jgi:CDP-glycerol glycerophosphotransferase (TagB/SpsB family)
MNRPIIFSVADEETYDRERGFMFDPLEPWMPGEKVKSQDELHNALRNALCGIDIYGGDRSFLRKLLHRYKDSRSSERVWAWIDKLMDVGKINYGSGSEERI